MRAILLLTGLLALSGCSPGALAEADASCDAEAVAHGLQGIETARHKNLCMRSRGFDRNTSCRQLTLDQSGKAGCFSPSWQFWVEKETLL